MTIPRRDMDQSGSVKSWSRGQRTRVIRRRLGRGELENARRKLRVRHGGHLERVDGELIELPIAADDEKCLQVHEALDRLEEIDPRKAEVVKMRIFIGLEVQEIAVALHASEKTVQRDWAFAKAWLSRELKEGA